MPGRKLSVVLVPLTAPIVANRDRGYGRAAKGLSAGDNKIAKAARATLGSLRWANILGYLILVANDKNVVLARRSTNSAQVTLLIPILPRLHPLQTPTCAAGYPKVPFQMLLFDTHGPIPSDSRRHRTSGAPALAHTPDNSPDFRGLSRLFLYKVARVAPCPHGEHCLRACRRVDLPSLSPARTVSPCRRHLLTAPPPRQCHCSLQTVVPRSF